MKKVLLAFSLLSLSTLFNSCKKHGCTDVNASNYSNVANVDDGSCMYPSDDVYVGLGTSNWQLTGSTYTTTFNVPEITQDVLDLGVVLVYKEFQPDTYEMLPITVPWGSTMLTIETSHSLGEVNIFWYHADQTTPTFPFVTSFKIVVLKHKSPTGGILDYAEEKANHNIE